MSVSESWLCKACKSFNILRVRFGFASGSNCFPNTLPMLKNNKCNICRTTLLKLRLSNMGSCLLTDLRFAHQSRCPGSFYHPSKRCGHCPTRETAGGFITETDGAHWPVTGLLRLWSTKRWNFLSVQSFRVSHSLIYRLYRHWCQAVLQSSAATWSFWSLNVAQTHPKTKT